jgi:hypothetical protein
VGDDWNVGCLHDARANIHDVNAKHVNDANRSEPNDLATNLLALTSNVMATSSMRTNELTHYVMNCSVMN